MKAINILCIGVFIMCCKQTELLTRWNPYRNPYKHAFGIPSGDKNIAYLDLPVILGLARTKEVRKWQAAYLLCSNSFVYNGFISEAGLKWICTWKMNKNKIKSPTLSKLWAKLLKFFRNTCSFRLMVLGILSLTWMHNTSWILCALQEKALNVLIYSLCFMLVHWLAPFQIFAVISPSCHTIQILAVKRLSSHDLINMGGGSSLTLEWFVLYPRLFSGLQYNKPNKWKVKQKLLQFSHRPFPNVSQGKGLTFPVPHPLPLLSAYNLTFFINLKIRLASSSSALHPFSSEYRLSYFLSENVQYFTICTVIWILFPSHFILSLDNRSPVVLSLQCLCSYFQDTELVSAESWDRTVTNSISWRSPVHTSVERNKACIHLLSRRYDSAFPSSAPMV